MIEKHLTIEEHLRLISEEQKEIKAAVLAIKKAKSKTELLEDPIIDLIDFCEMLHISKKKAYQIRMAGEIDWIQEPGSTKIYFRASAINAYLNRYHNKAFKSSA